MSLYIHNKYTQYTHIIMYIKTCIFNRCLTLVFIKFEVLIFCYSKIFVSPVAIENRPCETVWVPAEADWAVRSFHSACQSEIPHLSSEGQGGATPNQTGWETEPAVRRRVSQTHIHRHARSHIQMHEVMHYFQSCWSEMCRHGDLVWFISVFQ